MTILSPNEIRAIEYVRNTAGNVNVAGFDEDHDPIGPMLRQKIMPQYVVEGADGKLALTRAGMALLARPHA